MKTYAITYRSPRNRRVEHTMYQRATTPGQARSAAMAHMGGKNIILKVEEV